MSYLVFVMIAILVGVAAYAHDKHRTAKFNQRFPPIDDDEFVRRCGPGVNRDTAIRVRRIISQQLGVEYERVYPEQSFVNDLGCD